MQTTTTTADGQTIKEGSRVFNYYASTLDSGAIGTVGPIEADGWFTMVHDGGYTSSLNGERVCSIEHAEKSGWITNDDAPAHGIPRPRLATQPTTIEIVRNIENGHRTQAAEQITEHSEPARMAIAVLATLADGHTGCATAEEWRDAVATVVRTLNAAQ